MTPVLVLVYYIAQMKAAGIDLNQAALPWWKMIAATIAFAAWGAAIPDNGLFVNIDAAARGTVLGLAALFVSTALSVVAKLFEKQ